MATREKGRLDDLDSPIARESVAEQVAHRILELVKSGSLKPGDQLPTERDLAASLQVSRPSVREALRGLSILGVIKSRQGGGAFISSLDATSLLEPLQFFITLDERNVDELYDARIMIESGIARHAAGNMSDEQIHRLRSMLEPQKLMVGDPVGYRVSDGAFHGLIWEGSGNRLLARIAQGLNVLGMEFRRIASETPGVLEQSQKDHVAIVEALEARDPGAAAAAAAAHMGNVYRTTIAAMRAKR